MKIRQTYILIGITMLSLSCSRPKDIIKYDDTNHEVATESSADDGVIEITILQVNDVYELSPLEGGKSGGMARVEKLHRDLVAKNPNTLLVHGGDFLNPSLMGMLKQDGVRVKGRQMIEMMNYMNFDLVAFGNHEFDLKYEELQQRLNESTFGWIGTNIKHVDGDDKSPFYIEHDGVRTDVPRYRVFHFTDIDGTELDLGFISATINSNPKDYVEYADFYESAKLVYQQVLPKSDLVLGLTHLKISQDKLFSRTLPDIPLIMGGHEHENSKDVVGKAVITKADANVRSVYVHHVIVDKKNNKTDITSELVIIDDTKEEDPGAAAIAKKWADFQLTSLGDVVDNPTDVIYHSDVKLDGRDTQIRSEQTNLGTIIAESMARVYGIDAAFVNGGSIRFDDQLEGDITGVDIFRALPYGGGVLKIKITGRQLVKVLQEGYLKAGTGAYLQLFGFEKDEEWKIGGKPIESNTIYEVAISDYLIKGYDIVSLKEGLPEIEEVYYPSETEQAADIRKVIIDFLKQK